MTTVATDGKSMAGDGLICENDRVCMTDYAKVRRLKDGRIAGVSGNAFNWEGFFNWLNDGGDFPKMVDTFSGLVLSLDGSVASYDDHGRSFPEQPPVAIGSGSPLAVAAMDAGMCAHRAVELACARDINSGGTITVEGLPSALQVVETA